MTTCFGSFVAEVAEVSVEASGKPRVHRIVAAVDCGRAVNPDVVRRQVEGAIACRPQRRAVPEIHVQGRARRAVELRRLPDAAHGRDAQGRGAHRAEQRGPGGIGEPGLPPATPAVVNAIFAATGRPSGRCRSRSSSTGTPVRKRQCVAPGARGQARAVSYHHGSTWRWCSLT
ncbi:MAG: xanthine dehydrogenase family protein molybdopterin-binding subunit [Proteobacteria bacterium]|nr:xanthine dehydrogenase family protein molybdopterin-binding subunit [Pseudomonadota bacterium]